MSEREPPIVLASLDDVRAALAAALPALLKTAIAEAMQRREEPPFVSVKRAAELTGASVASIRRRCEDGSIKWKRLGSRILIATDSLHMVDEVAIARAAALAVAR
jgi:hypothetical protein